jgi:O-antigen ligase
MRVHRMPYGKHGTAFDNMDVPISRLDIVIESLLIGLLAFMPLAFGAVQAWSEEVVIALSGAITVCFVLKLVCCRRRAVIWSWCYVPLGIFLLIAILQLISLPASLVGVISPNTAALKTELLGDLPNSETVLKSMTLSFYPDATKHDLRLVLAVAAVFVVVLNVFRRPEQIKRLLKTIALIGGIIALIALAQNVFGNGEIYWCVSTPNSKGYSGPFINHSNYGQFINLSIGAALALLVVKLHEGFVGKKITPPAVFEYLSCSSAKFLWLLVAVMSLGAATVFLSLTRGGMISTLIAGILTTLLFAWRRSLKGCGWIMVVIALVAFTCVLYVGFDAVYDRLATLRDFDRAEGGRLQILKDIAIAWTKFPILGTGLGTHSVVYPMFDRSTITALAMHAENEYAQAAEEIGLVGLGSLIIFGIIIGSNYVKNIRPAPIVRPGKRGAFTGFEAARIGNNWCGTNLPIRSAAYGLGFGILAILIHSLSDFGQHLPANSFLSAIFCALLLALPGRSQKQNPATQIITPFGKFKAIRGLALLVVSGIWVWALVGANNFRIAETHWRKALDIEEGLAERNWQGTEAEYADLISCAASAANYQPNNVKYRYWLNVYRWRSISQMTDADTGDTITPENSMASVHDIVDEFHKVRALCPTYGPVYSTVGQIEKFILNDDCGAEKIRKGFRLAPCDPIACFVAGYLDVSEGKIEDCIEKFKKAIQLDGSLFKDVVNIYANYLSRPGLAVSLAGDDISRLSYVANVLEDMQYNDLAEQTRQKIKDLLEARCSRSDAAASEFASLAKIYRRQQNNNLAIEYYRRALVLNYAQVYWRFELAQLLADVEKIAEAMDEARICLRLHPQFKQAERLVADLSINPVAFREEIKSP